MLVSFVLGDANFLRRPCTFHFFCADFFALGSKRKPNSQWNIGGVGCLALGLCVGHVHFMRQVMQTHRERLAGHLLGFCFNFHNGKKCSGYDYKHNCYKCNESHRVSHCTKVKSVDFGKRGTWKGMTKCSRFI